MCFWSLLKLTERCQLATPHLFCVKEWHTNKNHSEPNIIVAYPWMTVARLSCARSSSSIRRSSPGALLSAKRTAWRVPLPWLCVYKLARGNLVLLGKTCSWKSCLGNASWIENGSWNLCLQNLFLGTLLGNLFLETSSWEPLHGNFFLRTLLVLKPSSATSSCEPCWTSCWEPLLGDLFLEPCLGTLLGNFAGNLAWEPCLGTLLGNLFLGTLLGHLLLGSLAWEALPGNLFLGTSWEPYLGTCSWNLAWKPCLGTSSWEPCLGTSSWEPGSQPPPCGFGCSEGFSWKRRPSPGTRFPILRRADLAASTCSGTFTMAEDPKLTMLGKNWRLKLWKTKLLHEKKNSGRCRNDFRAKLQSVHRKPKVEMWKLSSATSIKNWLKRWKVSFRARHPWKPGKWKCKRSSRARSPSKTEGLKMWKQSFSSESPSKL